MSSQVTFVNLGFVNWCYPLASCQVGISTPLAQIRKVTLGG